MKIAKYIIIDIETLGIRNNAAITQIGVVIADENFNILDKRLIQIDPKTWSSCDRTFTDETLLWGMNKKNSPVSGTYTYNVKSYQTAILTLDVIFQRYNTDDTIVWTKGTMDLFCIKDLCEYFNMNTPWKFWQPRDIRTAKEIIKDWKVCENNNAHNALDDALIELEELKINLIKN